MEHSESMGDRRPVSMTVGLYTGMIVLLTMGVCQAQNAGGSDLADLTQISMDQTDLLGQYVLYNLWANGRIASWLDTLDEERFIREVESSFSSIRKTVAHIWNAERGWLNYVQDAPWGAAPASKFSGDAVSMLTAWLDTSRDFVQYVSGAEPFNLYRPKLTENAEPGHTYAQMIMHCMNHSTYHRGQLITIGRQLGLTSPPQTDFIFYLGQ